MIKLVRTNEDISFTTTSIMLNMLEHQIASSWHSKLETIAAIANAKRWNEPVEQLSLQTSVGQVVVNMSELVDISSMQLISADLNRETPQIFDGRVGFNRRSEIRDIYGINERAKFFA